MLDKALSQRAPKLGSNRWELAVTKTLRDIGGIGGWTCRPTAATPLLKVWVSSIVVTKKGAVEVRGTSIELEMGHTAGLPLFVLWSGIVRLAHIEEEERERENTPC